MHKFTVIVKALVVPTIFVLLWSVAVQTQWLNPKLIPTPTAVLQKAWFVIHQANFLNGLLESLIRNGIGFAIGGILGVSFGLWVGLSRLAQWILAPSFHLLRQISLFAWLPLISTFLGYEHVAKVLFISLSVFYPVALKTLEGVSSISYKYQEVAKVYQFPKLYVLRKVILPGAASHIFVGLQLGLMFAWLATVGSEFLLASYGNGLGNLVIQGRQAFDVALIIVGMVVIGAVGVTMNAILQRIERKILRWQQPE